MKKLKKQWKITFNILSIIIGFNLYKHIGYTSNVTYEVMMWGMLFLILDTNINIWNS